MFREILFAFRRKITPSYPPRNKPKVFIKVRLELDPIYNSDTFCLPHQRTKRYVIQSLVRLGYHDKKMIWFLMGEEAQSVFPKTQRCIAQVREANRESTILRLPNSALIY